MAETAAELRAAIRTERPQILVFVNERLRRGQIDDILYGIEEEGIPYAVRTSTELNPLVLAHLASLESRLGVGIGISLDYVVITTEKLPERRPYLAQVLNYNRDQDRVLGSNAARIVKRTPLTGVAASG